MIISLYPNTFEKNFTLVSPETVMEGIMQGTWENHISYLRTLDKAKYDSEKKKLPAVTWSGTFKQGTRLIESLEKYSGIVVLDVDKLHPDNIELLKSQLFNDEYVKCCFVSPSNNGIKILIQVNTGPEHHRAAFLHLQKVFEEKYLFKVDPSGKDVCRLCYVSFDPSMVFKTNNKVFEVDTKYGEIITEHRQAFENSKVTDDIKKIFAVCIKWVERSKSYQDGEKNVYIHALACALNRCGVSQESAIELIGVNLPTPDIKWHQSVRSAYFHNQYEHGKIQIKDIGVTPFVAPPYVANFNDDIVADDIMRTTAMLYSHKVPNDLILDYVGKLANFYNGLGWIDMRKNDLGQMMNKAVNVLNQNIANNASQHALKYETAEKMIDELVSMDLSGVIKTYIPPLDKMIGGFLPGNVYAIIGFGETFKSILAQYWAYMNAINNVPVLYLNSEMSKIQYYERHVIQAMGVNLRAALLSGNITKETSDSFREQVEAVTKNNIFVFSGIDHSKVSILATIDHIYASTGKKIKMVIMDGLSQMFQNGKEEAPANIMNSGICKEISKEAHGGEGVVLIPLIHCSGSENKLIRNTGTIVRGGSKMIANLDGYFSTSLFIDTSEQNLDNPTDINYIEGKFCLRFNDKRGGTGVHYNVMNLVDRLMLQHEETDYRQYEVKPN